MERKLKLEEENLYSRSIFTDTELNIVRLKESINEIMEQKTKGAIVRSRANWALGGEKPTTYFLGLEKSNHNSRVIEALLTNDGVLN